MSEIFAFLLVLHLLLLLLVLPSPFAQANEDCQIRHLSGPSPPSAGADATAFSARLLQQLLTTPNLTSMAQAAISAHPGAVGVALAAPTQRVLGLSVNRRLQVFPNSTAETAAFWTSFDHAAEGWTPPFRDCHFFRDVWLHSRKAAGAGGGAIAVFLKVQLDQCEDGLREIFHNRERCDRETTQCVTLPSYGEQRGGYLCQCRQGFFHPGANLSWKGLPGELLEHGLIDEPRCQPCPSNCELCEMNGVCTRRRDVYLKTTILSIQLGGMAITVILALVVFKQRKTKSIASGMWTILETILLGIFILYCTVVVRLLEPSVLQCLLEPWAREVGFIVCYGAIILKLYRHLIEFRTRKAHRWVVKDTDLLKYLFIMVLSVCAYLAAYTAIMLNFQQENFAILQKSTAADGAPFESCKILWWDYVTETGEVAILIFGIHLSYVTRNAKTQFHERGFLCAAISLELVVSVVFYVGRVVVLPTLHPDLILVVHCLRSQLSTTVNLLLIFLPKLWYQQKQVRSLAQEYSCRFPVDAFKDGNAHGPLAGNNSDAEVGEVTLADMSPDDIRAELKRLYMQLGILKARTLCKDNPHISKRRGGRKAQHRRFSLQKKGSREKNLHGKQRAQKQEETTTEAEASRTPEDSVCSNEGASGIYSDLPSSADHK